VGLHILWERELAGGQCSMVGTAGRDTPRCAPLVLYGLGAGHWALLLLRMVLVVVHRSVRTAKDCAHSYLWWPAMTRVAALSLFLSSLSVRVRVVLAVDVSTWMWGSLGYNGVDVARTMIVQQLLERQKIEL